MTDFVSLAWMGCASVGAVLTWRLFIAIENQRKLEVSIAESTETLEREREDLSSVMIRQTETLEALTQENLRLKQQAESHQVSFSQLQADRQALQYKYAELEQDLLAAISNGKTLEQTLQAQKLEHARLNRQVESVQKRQILQQEEQHTLQVQHQKVADKNQLYHQAVVAAKVKIERLNQEKKQLQRDLQQALYKVVELEKEQPSLNSDFQASEWARVSTIPSNNSEKIVPSLPQFN